MVSVAVATDDGVTVAPHFGKARYFLIVSFEDGREVSRRLVENLHARSHERGHGQGHGCRDVHDDSTVGRHGFDHGHGAFGGRHGGHEDVFRSLDSVMKVIASRIGPHMFEDLKQRNFEVFIVPAGASVDEALRLFLDGKLTNVASRRNPA